VFREASKKTLYLASAPNVGQALDAGGVLSGEAAESPKGESSKEPSANAMPQRAYAKGRPTNVRCRPIPVIRDPLGDCGNQADNSLGFRIWERRDG